MTPRRERHGPIDRDSTSRESDVTERSRQNEVVTRHAPATVTAPSRTRYTRHRVPRSALSVTLVPVGSGTTLF